MNRLLTAAVAAIAIVSASATQAGASSIILTDLSQGYYNASIGETLDGSFGFPDNNVDPTYAPIAPAPDLTAAAGILGTWLTQAPPSGGIGWTGLQAIPYGWSVYTETAIVMPFLLSADSILIANFGVDNGLYVWLDGVYMFGARQPGGVGIYEYPNFNLGIVDAGQHFLQIMREDSGGATGWAMSISATEVPEPATMMLLGTGLAGLVARRRRKA